MADYETDIGVSIDLETKLALQMFTSLNASLKLVRDNMEAIHNTISTTVDGFNKMTLGFKRLDELNTKRATENLNEMSNAVNKMSERFNSLAFQKFNSGASALADTMSRLTSSSKRFSNLTIPDLSSIGTVNVAPIERFFSSLNAIDPSKVNLIGNALKSLSAGMKGMQNLNFELDIPQNMQSKLESTANTLRDFVEKISNFNLNGLTSFAKDIKSIPRAMQGIEKLDASKIGNVFSTLATQIQPFLAHLKEASAEIQGLANITNAINRFGRHMKNAKEYTRQVGNEAETTRKKLNNMLSYGKIYALYNQFRHFGSGFANMLNQAIDFTEVENYFSRAMGNMRNEAMKFQNQMSDMFGLSMPSMMKAQATFKNMLSSLGGLTDEFSSQMSERLSKMAVDFASLYNVSIDSSITKFQSALSRQVRPIRSVSGYDITQNVLETTAQSIGIYDRAIIKMNEMEKRLLIILTLQQQMARSSAMGDYARTIESPSNQLKVLQQQIAEVGRWISAVFYGVIGKVLPYINGFVLAIKELIRTFAFFLGYEMPDTSGQTGTILDGIDDSFGGISDDIGNINGGLDDTNDKLDDAKKKTKEWKNFSASFDVFNKIPDQSDSDSNSGSDKGSGNDDIGAGFVDPRILNALKNMDYLFGNIRMKAQDIRDQLLKWAGILGGIIDENIFQPIKNSWDKYGESIMTHAKKSFDNLRFIFSGIFDVIGDKWKPFFQQASNLFFSLMDTAFLVSDKISGFLKFIWINGGKFLLEALADLATAFLKLATSINDYFIKPLINGLSNMLLPIFGVIISTVLSLSGAVIRTFAFLIDKLADCEPLVIALGSAFTALFLTIKIAKIIELSTALGGTHSILRSIGALALQNSSILRKLWLSFSDGNSKIGGALKSFKSFNTYLLGTKVWGVVSAGLTAISKGLLLFNTTALASIPIIGTLASFIVTKLSSAFAFLATNPAVLAVIAITAVITAITLLGRTQKEKKYEMDDYSESIQEQVKSAQDLADSLGKVNKSSQDALSDKLADVEIISNYIDKLREMGGESGYVDNAELAGYYIEKINEKLPETVKLTEEGRIEWEKTPDAIYKSIEALKERAKIEATEALYVESIKAGIKAENDRAVAQGDLNKKLERQAELRQLAMKDSKKYEDELKQVSADIVGLQETIDTCDSTIKLADDTNKQYEITLGNLGETGEKTAKKLELSYQGLSDKGNEAFNNLGTKMLEMDRQLQESAENGKTLTEAEIKSRREAKEEIIKQYAEQAVAYDKNFDDMKTILSEQGVKLNEEELVMLEKSIKNQDKAKAELLRITKISGSDLSKEQDTQYKDFLTAMQKNGIELNSEKARQYRDLYNLYDTHGKSMDTGQKFQYAQFLSKAHQLGIDLNTEEGKQHQQSYFDAQKSGLDVGDVYISKMKQGVSSKNINGEIDNILNNAQTNVDGKPIYMKIDAYMDKNNLNRLLDNIKENISSLRFNFKSTSVQSKGSASMSFVPYATGGFPSLGEFFVAREAGPELIGRMGSRSAVANNDQITTGIYKAVLQAMTESGSARENGGDLYLTIQNTDGTTTEKVIRDYKKYSMFSGGRGGFNL